jgi:uncharacterized membrane protein
MANTQGMAEHHASVAVNAPIHQVYGLFTHFNDFPKFMSFVKEVTYYDNQTSHWVAEIAGRHEWDAVNEGWVEDQQIGWRSIKGLENNGRVMFRPTGTNQTMVDVFINYNPPAGILGDVGEKLGVGSRFEAALQHDLDNFARMVSQAPPGALDPTSSNYLFHSGSAAAKGTTTSRQNETMNEDRSTGTNAGTGSSNPGTSTGRDYGAGTGSSGYSTDRPALDQDIINERSNAPYSAGSGVGRGTMDEQETVLPDERGTRDPLMPPGEDRTYQG